MNPDLYFIVNTTCSFELKITITMSHIYICEKFATETFSYHCFNPLRIQESVVERVHIIIRVDITRPLQKDGPSVQTIVCPENAETCPLVSFDQGPGNKDTCT